MGGGACQPHPSGRESVARTKRTGANFFAQSVLSADAEVESMRRGVGHWMLVKSEGTCVSYRSNKKSRKEKKVRGRVNNGER